LTYFLICFSNGKKIEYYSLVPLQVFEFNNSELYESTLGKNNSIKESYQFNNTTSLIENLEVKNITYTEDDIILTNFTLTEEIDLFNTNTTMEKNLPISLISEEDLGDKLEEVIILGNNETIKNTFNSSPLILENNNEQNVILEGNKLYKYHKIEDKYCDDEGFYTIEKFNITFYHDSCHSQVYFCPGSDETLSMDPTEIYIDPSEIDEACKLISNNNYLEKREIDKCGAIAATLATLFAIMSVIVPGGEITTLVVAGAALAGGSASASSIECLVANAFNKKDGDYCCIKESVSQTCGGLYAPCNHYFSPRVCSSLWDIS